MECELPSSHHEPTSGGTRPSSSCDGGCANEETWVSSIEEEDLDDGTMPTVVEITTMNLVVIVIRLGIDDGVVVYKINLVFLHILVSEFLL
jgi:hypothetical protein